MDTTQFSIKVKMNFPAIIADISFFCISLTASNIPPCLAF